MNIDQEFSEKVQDHLHGLTASIKPVLKELIEYDYPKEVINLEFEIFADGFTQGFPVRAFFMDSDDSEHFVYINDEAQYPSPVELELLEIEYVYPYELEKNMSMRIKILTHGVSLLMSLSSGFQSTGKRWVENRLS